LPPRPPPPSLPLPATPAPQAAIIAELNRRFREGHASNDLASAGVLLRQFDMTEDQTMPWRGCPNHVAFEGAGNECAIYGGRFSASIVNAPGSTSAKAELSKISLFSKDSGVVYNPQATKLNCIYAGDGGTRKLPDDGCGDRSWFCDPERSARDSWCDGRPIAPENMADALRGQTAGSYNEAVINTAHIDAHLPQAVDAFFFVSDARPSLRKRAEEAHAKFHAKYADLHADQAPLLCVDVKDLSTPFRPPDCFHH
jgi:hypothetical protein